MGKLDKEIQSNVDKIVFNMQDVVSDLSDDEKSDLIKYFQSLAKEIGITFHPVKVEKISEFGDCNECSMKDTCEEMRNLYRHFQSSPECDICAIAEFIYGGLSTDSLKEEDVEKKYLDLLNEGSVLREHY